MKAWEKEMSKSVKGKLSEKLTKEIKESESE